MRREFDLPFSFKDSRMISNPILLDHDLEMVGIGEDLAGSVGIRRGDGVAIGFKLDKTGLADGGGDDPIGAIGDSRKGFELFFLQGLRGCFLRSSMESLVPLHPPEAQLSIQVPQILEGVDPEEIPDIPDHPLHPPFLIGPIRITGMNREPIMPREIQKLAVEL
jgi:hypothetical protein